MSEHDETGKPALRRDNPDPDRGGEGDKGLGTDTGASGEGSDVIEEMPEARGEVRYPDVEDPDELRPEGVPEEGAVEQDPDTETDAAPGAED